MKKFLPLLIISAFTLGMILVIATISFSPEKSKLPSPPMKSISAAQDAEINPYLINLAESTSKTENESATSVQPVAQLVVSQEEVVSATSR
ncbi:MAG: hypothetical protein AAF655_05310 [Bacteroidota bacterium]